MRKITQFSKVITFTIALCFGAISYAQVGIGTATPEPRSVLDVSSTNKGFLVPRVDILNLATIAPVTGGATTEPLLVWNTNTTTGVGFHYWNGSNRWVPLTSAANNTNWALTGNAATVPGTNFIGTTDANDLEIFTNGTRKIDISTNGNVGIGAVAPATNTVRLEVDGGGFDGIYGHSTNVGGYLGRETNITIGNPAQTLLGAGVYANNPTAGYTSSFSQSTGAATVSASINYSNVWISSYNYVQNASATANPPGLYSQLNITNRNLAGNKTAFQTYTNRGNLNGNPGFTYGGILTADARAENSFGVQAVAFSDVASGGGDFADYTYLGALRSFSYVAFNNGTDYKILGSGTVSTLVEDGNNKIRTMFAPEAPEVLFQDFGVGQLVNGFAEISIDPILSKNIFVDGAHPLKVFIQLEGDCNGVFVTNKSASGFTVKELQNGQSNVSFSYQIVANRKDRKDGELGDESKFQDLRFPIFDDSKIKRKIDKNLFIKTLASPEKKEK